MNDSFFRNDLNEEKDVLKENIKLGDKKILSKINNRFSNDQTNAKIVLLVGVLAIIFGTWHLVSGIKNAFVLSPIVLEDKSGVIENLNQLKDTDSDGISDYDERYIYGTSPYLADTDSDGVSDYDEIVAGQAPLCIGDTCQENLEEPVDTSITDLEPPTLMSLEQLKAELIQAGYPAEEVNKLSEADLNLIYAEVERAVNDENYTYTGLDVDNSTEKYAPTAEELEQLQNLSIDQIKELLIQGGATAEQLESVDDEELRNLYIEALQSL